uniref:Uncharacterized protein n=1 Tax=Accipiter nisus TaxID=211598 RepID=A0A8B9MNN3_9AVES
VELLRSLLSRTLGLGKKPEKVLDELTLEGVSHCQDPRFPLAWHWALHQPAELPPALP